THRQAGRRRAVSARRVVPSGGRRVLRSQARSWRPMIAILAVALGTTVPAADAQDKAGGEGRREKTAKSSSQRRAAQQEAPAAPAPPVLVRDATIWTESGSGSDPGILEHADMLV